MITKKLFEDITTSRSKGKVHFKYKGKQLAVIAEGVLFQLLLDAAPTSFLTDLAKIGGVKTQSSNFSKAVIKIASVYSFERFRWLGKSPTGLSDASVVKYRDQLLEDKTVVADFKKAIQVMIDAGFKDMTKFIHVQIEGLKFVNDGKGVFPSTKQLATPKALDRALDFSASDSKPSDNKKEKPKEYWYFNKDIDGQLTFEKNEKYKEVMKAIDAKTATMEMCLYASRCFSARRDGKTYRKINDYIKTISK